MGKKNRGEELDFVGNIQEIFFFGGGAWSFSCG